MESDRLYGVKIGNGGKFPPHGLSARLVRAPSADDAAITFYADGEYYTTNDSEFVSVVIGEGDTVNWDDVAVG